ncbi:fatty acid hydroxylase superfamily protein [Zymoseptoria brevis]|uniref:Fatty acid hydroxylase superfamily protein n=1 Tax=Zymoseptoria brevis TaxID=1047168 RepID=A0A0F4GAU5_9PEZI|nr:fatty acid hydroxylase superfamily protein [Zymoseptoria brevis]
MSVQRNPKDSMKSTWRTADKSTWTFHHRLYDILNVHPTDINKPVPVHQKTDKMPYLAHWSTHRWILTHSLWPIAVAQLYTYYFGKNMPVIAAFAFYTIAFHINAINHIYILRRLGHKWGFLDGDKHERDQVPDVSVKKVFDSLSLTAVVRPLITIFLAYRKNVAPIESLSWWLPVEIGVYGIVLDFFFYWYHRVMHEYEGLWKFHRTHHLTKHPNPLLSLYADTEQEIFDIAIVPIATWGAMKLLGFPMGFGDWWVCHHYLFFTELFGHSGLRVFSTPASTNTYFLRFFNAELATEDHDLHHRQGWKKSHNYGKQTLLWDRIFGTAGDRIEMSEQNVDRDNTLVYPLF